MKPNCKDSCVRGGVGRALFCVVFSRQHLICALDHSDGTCVLAQDVPQKGHQSSRTRMHRRIAALAYSSKAGEGNSKDCRSWTSKIADRGHQKAHVRRDQRAHSNTVPQRTGKAKDKDHEVLFPEGTQLTLRRSNSKTLEGGNLEKMTGFLVSTAKA